MDTKEENVTNQQSESTEEENKGVSQQEQEDVEEEEIPLFKKVN